MTDAIERCVYCGDGPDSDYHRRTDGTAREPKPSPGVEEVARAVLALTVTGPSEAVVQAAARVIAEQRADAERQAVQRERVRLEAIADKAEGRGWDESAEAIRAAVRNTGFVRHMEDVDA